jgi:hypothetical protein
LPGGELIDRLQKIAGNVADRQYLNSRRLPQWSNGSGALTSSCPKINLSSASPAISAASVVIVLFIYFIYLFLVVWVVVAERAAVTGPRRNFVWIFGPSLISFSGNGGAEVPKKFEKLSRDSRND